MPRSREEKDYMHSAIITKITKLFFFLVHKSRLTAAEFFFFFFFALHGTVMKLRATDTRALGESNVFILG